MRIVDRHSTWGHTFQSAPGREAGRCVKLAATLRHLRSFNPRPAVRPGDALISPSLSPSLSSFNPRPAVRPGDA